VTCLDIDLPRKVCEKRILAQSWEDTDDLAVAVVVINPLNQPTLVLSFNDDYDDVYAAHLLCF
jgi:hypothetical protein